LSETEKRRLELSKTIDYLKITITMSMSVLDDKMRKTVKELLGYRYMLKPLSDKQKKIDEDRLLFINAAEFADKVFGTEPREWVKSRKSYELERDRPVRIYDYVQKIADIFPAEHLTRLVYCSKQLSPEALIAYFEAEKGEASGSDYVGEPSGIDPSTYARA
jgi:hypothetical protein